MKLVLITSCLLLAPMAVSAQMDHTHSPATAEDCTKLSPELQEVVTAMDGPGLRLCRGWRATRQLNPASANWR